MLTPEEKRLIHEYLGPHRIYVLKNLKSMTNNNLLIEVDGLKYVLRRPGKGTTDLVSRENEYEAYAAIKDLDISDELVFFDKDNGLKLTHYIEDARTCNPNNLYDVYLCMRKLESLHNMQIRVDKVFDLYATIDKYESLMGKSEYPDYVDTKLRVEKLKFYLPKTQDDFCLAHIDPNQDNFLIGKDLQVHLIDWEYAAMQDPHVDIAMFAIYAEYDEEQIKRLIKIYFGDKPSVKVMCQIYSYIAICGLLWSNWCEYKKKCGIDFGDYAKSQYEYARKFSRCAEWNM